jgi:hypothetical protein
MSVGRIGKLSPLDSPELRNSVDQIPFFNLRRSMNRDLRRVGGASAQRSSLSQTLEARRRDGRIFLARRSVELVWFPSYFSSSATQMQELFSASLAPFFSSPFLVRSFWFFFGNVLSFSSPTTSGRSFLEQGPEESVFFPTLFLFFFRDATSLVSEHSLCLFPWRFWFFPLFYFVHFGLNETNET